VEEGGAEAFLGAGVGAGIVIEAVALCGGTVALLGGAVALFRRSRKPSSKSFRRLCLWCRRSRCGTWSWTICRSSCSRRRTGYGA
jgi:hypothetical protein